MTHSPGFRGRKQGQVTTAAAEVGPTCDCYFPRREDCDAKLVAATIERCAQVADSYVQITPCEKTFTAKAIAAAIRALKDKP